MRMRYLTRTEHKSSIDPAEAIPGETHRLVVAGVPERGLIAPVPRSRLTGFALRRDRERVIEIGKVGDHALGGVRRLFVRLRRIVGAVVDGETVAGAREWPDVQKKPKRSDRERVLECDRVKVAPAPFRRVGAQPRDELTRRVLERDGWHAIPPAPRPVAPTAGP